MSKYFIQPQSGIRIGVNKGQKIEIIDVDGVRKMHCFWNIMIKSGDGYKSKVGDETMNRKELEEYIQSNYSTEPDYPWVKYPNYIVFRHQSNKKWFALIMDVSKNKLGLHEEDILDVVNFKCNPVLLGSLLDEKGFFPAYHMSKTNWITVALDGSVADDKIKMLLDMSFEMTEPKIHRKKM